MSLERLEPEPLPLGLVLVPRPILTATGERRDWQRERESVRTREQSPRRILSG